MIAGHSVGAYICLELLGQRSDLNILKSFMLLPTLHDIGATPNGAKLTVCLVRSIARADA